MKLRILKDSVRLRLTRSEVQRIGAGDSVVEATRLPAATLTYRLDVTDAEKISASFKSGSLAIGLPRSSAAAWAASDQVTIADTLASGDGQSLSVLVEKDFKCLSPGQHRSDDEDHDTFPHPEEHTGRGC